MIGAACRACTEVHAWTLSRLAALSRDIEKNGSVARMRVLTTEYRMLVQVRETFELARLKAAIVEDGYAQPRKTDKGAPRKDAGRGVSHGHGSGALGVPKTKPPTH